MQTWYECKVKYLKLDQGGFETKVNDNYLIDAVSYTDAESRIFEIMKEITRGDFQIVTIRKSTITEVVAKNDGEWWYRAKISMVTIDEEKGKEKKATQFILVMADDIHDALKQLEEGLSYMLIPYATTAISLSNIADVFPYVPGDQLKRVFDSVKKVEEDDDLEEEEIIEEEIEEEEEETDDQPEEEE
jgi:hypothetical protein